MASVSMETILKASADEAWEMIRCFNGIMKYLPSIAAGSKTGAGEGSIRRLLLTGGALVVERVERVKESQPRSVTYSILDSPLPIEGYLGAITVREISGSRCRLSWSSTFKPKGVSLDEAVGSVREAYTNAFRRLENLYGDYHVTDVVAGTCDIGEQQMEEEIKPRRNIVSVRLNDEEREVIEQIRLETCKSVSDIIREAMQTALHQLQSDAGMQGHSISGA